MAHDIAELESTVRALHEGISKLHGANHAERLMQMIHKPGWTTPRENELVRAHTHSLQGQLVNLHQSFDALLIIADKIGQN
jgi:hypothetical protein